MSMSNPFIISTISDTTHFCEDKTFVFADLFAGDGTVAASFKTNGCIVIANDFFYHNFVINRHYIENSSLMDTSISIHLNALSGIEGLIYQNYCFTEQCLFTEEAAKKCDAIRTELDNLYETGTIHDDEYYQFLASLIVSIDKYLKAQSKSKYFFMEYLPILEGEKGETYNYDPNYLISFIEGNALYLDPPFNFHSEQVNSIILENIAQYNNFLPLNSFAPNVNFAPLLDNIIATARFDYIFIRQNNEMAISFNTIKSILSNYGQYSSYAFPSMNDNKICAEFLHCIIKE